MPLQLSITEPNKIETGWFVSISAIVTDGRGSPLANVGVTFYHNGQRIGDPLPTEGDGRAMVDFPDLNPGVHTFEVQITSPFFARTRRVIPIKDTTPRVAIPDKLLVEVAGRNGEYEISILVKAADGKAIAGAIMEVIDERASPRIRRLKTDKNGSRLLKYSFTETERIITIRVLGGTDEKQLIWKKKLYGPRP